MNYYYRQNNCCYIKTYIQPRAKKNAVIGLHGERLKIQIKAPPDDGKANAELIGFLAKTLHIAANKISIVSGQHSRNKLIRIACSDIKTLLQEKICRGEF